MKKISFTLLLLALLSVCSAQKPLKRADMLTGKWKLVKSGIQTNGKNKWNNQPPGEYLIYEFGGGGSFSCLVFRQDTLNARMDGRWKLCEKESKICFEQIILNPPAKNVITLQLDKKIIKLTITELFISDQAVIADKGKNEALYLFKKVK